MVDIRGGILEDCIASWTSRGFYHIAFSFIDAEGFNFICFKNFFTRNDSKCSVVSVQLSDVTIATICDNYPFQCLHRYLHFPSLFWNRIYSLFLLKDNDFSANKLAQAWNMLFWIQILRNLRKRQLRKILKLNNLNFQGVLVSFLK